MREIKFRGKRVDTGEWFFGYLYTYPVKNGLFCDLGTLVIGNDAEHHMIDPTTVGQYTGLKDKNGVEIFEGDIVRFDGKYDYPVWFDEGTFCTNAYGDFDPLHIFLKGARCKAGQYIVPFEVIGNLHDNPELIEGGK